MRNLWLLAVCLILASFANTTLGLPGSGTQEDPWRIESLADFNEFAADPNYWDDWTRLETDINLAGQTYSTAVIAPDVNNSNLYFDGLAFTGVFDGNGHEVTGLTIDDGGAGNTYQGLFGLIDGGEVRNLGLEAVSVRGTGLGWYVGGLVGWNEGILSNCYSTGDVTGCDYVGGLVGVNLNSSVSNCYSTGDVSGNSRVGGMVGFNYYSGSVSNCYSTGDVSGNSYVGGLVGQNYYWRGGILNCYSTGNVNGNSYVGGLVGDSLFSGSVSNCYSTGNVDGNSDVGGLVGDNLFSGSISNCYSTGDVSGDSDVGGLVGFNFRSGIVSNCYSTGDVSGGRYVGGLVGYNHQYCSVSRCYSTGNVSGDSRVGGLVGLNYYHCSVSNSHSTGDVSGFSYVGGLVGRHYWSGSILNCYSAGSVSGDEYIGGLVGHNSRYVGISNCFWDIDTQTHGVTESIGYNDGTVTNIKYLPTDQMQDINTYLDAGWDFTTPIWKMCGLPDYPRLWWEKCPIEADVMIEPDTLNLASKGNWLTCHIRLPEDYNVVDIDPNSVFLEGIVSAESLQINNNAAVVKFSRPEVQDILITGECELTVTGELIDGTIFEGSDTIRVINSGGGKTKK